MDRRPGPAGVRVGAGPQDLAQNLPVVGHAELLADDLDYLLRAVACQRPAGFRFLGGHAVGGGVDQVADQAGPQGVQRRRHPGAEERYGLAGRQVAAQRA